MYINLNNVLAKGCYIFYDGRPFFGGLTAHIANGEIDIEKTYTMPKSRVKYRMLIRISGAKRKQSREAIKKVNVKEKVLLIVR